MAEVIVNKSINVSAEDAWNKLSSFRGIEEFSPIERSETVGEGAGATRTCYMPDGAAIYEVLNEVDHSAMEFQYTITEGPFPVSGYVSTVKVESTGDGTCKNYLDLIQSMYFEHNASTEGMFESLLI